MSGMLLADTRGAVFVDDINKDDSDDIDYMMMMMMMMSEVEGRRRI